MYKEEDIRTIHIEITERCNLSCLMCDRNKNGGEVNQYLKNRELTFQDIHRTFLPSFIKQLKRIYFCGNYGDPIMAKDLMQILKYFRYHNPKLKLSLITNGSFKNAEWWAEVATIVTSVRFGIDGLKDTNNIYRKNSDWDLIMENVKSYIKAGGYAIWDYLVFGHNEHQIQKARELSMDLMFKEFVVKKTGRFFSNIKLEGKENHVGLTKPIQEKNQNKSLNKEQTIINRYGSIEKYLDQTKIECKVLKNKEIYISAEGIVLPCCWLAGQMYKWYLPKKSTEIWYMIDKNRDEINIKKNNLYSILEFNNTFKNIKDSWDKKSLRDGKLKTCALKCGKELDQFGDQFK